MKPLEYVTKNEKEVLAFLKTQYPLYHLSNIFFRDVQYGIQTFFERRGDKVGYQDAEKAARAFVEKLVSEKIFTPIDRQSWVLNYPAYKTVAVKPTAPAKAAPGAAPAKSPAAARTPLPPLGGAKPAGATPALPPLGSGKPVGGAKPSLPPLTSAKPAGGTKPSLPPLTSARPAAGAKPALPSIESAKPAAAQTVQVEPSEPQAEVQTVETPKPVVTQASGSTASVPPPGQRKPLPPLRGNYTPAGKK